MSDWIIERYASEVVENEGNELASLKEKYNQLQENYDTAIKKQYHNDYTIANQKRYLEEMAKSNQELEEENKILKYFARKYLVE